MTTLDRLLPPANEVWGKVIFLHLFVILFTGGVPDQVHPQNQVHPQDQVPPRSRHPHGTRYPPEQSMLGGTVNVRAVRILLECNLVR